MFDQIPANLKIYHILHCDKLPAVLQSKGLLSDAIITNQEQNGTTIGMNKIKFRRLNKILLTSHPELYVGQCVPFYFCPRSVMLFMIHKGNHPELDYTAGQSSILHLVADLKQTVQWANRNNKRWAFTTSNAGSFYFNDFADINFLNKINWNAVNATYWSQCRDEKQAEFLIEDFLPWELIEQIGVFSTEYDRIVTSCLETTNHRPKVQVHRDWYY